MTESTDTSTENTSQEPSELDLIKQRLTIMNVKFHPNSKLDSLKLKLEAALNDTPPEVEKTETVAPVEAKPLTEAQIRMMKRKKAERLVRINITCMNTRKKEQQGEIFCVSNSVIGTIKKYVPYNQDYHVPQAILNMIQERQCQTFVPVKDKFGNTVRTPKMIKEFGVNILTPLTAHEIKELADRQAQAGSIQQ